MSRPHEVTIAILNYNGRRYLADTIGSILALEYHANQVLIVDDGSQDGSVEYVRRHYPSIRIVEMGTNTKMLNRVRNRAIAAARTDLVLITDNDISFAPDCLTRLIQAMLALPDAAALTPRVMYEADHNRIYIDSNRFHYVCTSIDEHRDKTLNEIGADRDFPVRTFGCGIMLISKSKAAKIGFFDEDYVMGWGDDGEFHHRINLSGMKSYAVSNAIVYHKAIKGPARIYGQIRNRWFLILQTYSCKTLFVALPALLVYELAILVFLLHLKSLSEYVRAAKDTIRMLGPLIEKRRRIQSYKVVADKELMVAGNIFFPSVYQRNALVCSALAIFNRMLKSYWNFALRLL